MSSTADLAPVQARDVLQGDLTEQEKEILEFERAWWKHAGAKESAIREKWDISSTRYYQLLQVLIEKPSALAYDPMLVKRLQRLRDVRRAQRSANRPT